MSYLRERVIEPIVIPLVAVALIGFGVLNLSRLFLASAHANRAVPVASLIAAGILAGAAWATSREKIDRGVLLGGAALLGVVLSGAGLVAQEVDLDQRPEPGGGGEVASKITVTAVNFTFPSGPVETAGPRIQVTYQVEEGSHTWVVEGHEDEFKLQGAEGSTDTDVLELEPGEYVFYCDVPGHRDLGMESTLTVTEGGGEGGAAAGPAVEVVAEDFDFPTKAFEATGGTVNFEYVNNGSSFHTLVVDGLEDEMRIEAPGGETGTDGLQLDPGTYTLYCDVPGHREQGMEATLTVS